MQSRHKNNHKDIVCIWLPLSLMFLVIQRKTQKAERRLQSGLSRRRQQGGLEGGSDDAMRPLWQGVI